MTFCKLTDVSGEMRGTKESTNTCIAEYFCKAELEKPLIMTLLLGL